MLQSSVLIGLHGLYHSPRSVLYHAHLCAYNIQVKIDFDPKKAASNLKKHGVSFDEAATCLLDPQALVRDDPDARDEVRLLLLGMSHTGRLITVCYTLRDEEAIRLISARPATKKEEKNYA
jgi:uncharacterized DUF497 family protein